MRNPGVLGGEKPHSRFRTEEELAAARKANLEEKTWFLHNWNAIPVSTNEGPKWKVESLRELAAAARGNSPCLKER